MPTLCLQGTPVKYSAKISLATFSAVSSSFSPKTQQFIEGEKYTPKVARSKSQVKAILYVAVGFLTWLMRKHGYLFEF